MRETKHTYCRDCEPNCGLLATVHPADADRIGVCDGDAIVVHSATGTILLPARLIGIRISVEEA